MAPVRRTIQAIAHDYQLSPKVAQALLEKILNILQAYWDGQNEHTKEEDE